MKTHACQQMSVYSNTLFKTDCDQEEKRNKKNSRGKWIAVNIDFILFFKKKKRN